MPSFHGRAQSVQYYLQLFTLIYSSQMLQMWYPCPRMRPVHVCVVSWCLLGGLLVVSSSIANFLVCMLRVSCPSLMLSFPDRQSQRPQEPASASAVAEASWIVFRVYDSGAVRRETGVRLLRLQAKQDFPPAYNGVSGFIVSLDEGIPLLSMHSLTGACALAPSALARSHLREIRSQSYSTSGVMH